MESIAVLDFGSQTSQLIARRVREAQVYCELFPHDAPSDRVLATNPAGYILSGGPASIYESTAPQVPDFVFASGRPILGICYGMQALSTALGGQVAQAVEKEFGAAEIEVENDSDLLDHGVQTVWMSHGDRVDTLPSGFEVIATSRNSPNAAIRDSESRIYGLQFHPEVRHTQGGAEILRRFAVEICGAATNWTPAAIIPLSIRTIQDQVGETRALAAVSGGVDSAVATALAYQALGDRLQCVFVDTGLLRKDERDYVAASLSPLLGDRLEVVESDHRFLTALEGVTDPERKRQIIGELFIRVFEEEAERLGRPHYLVQGTIYPDVVESSGPGRRAAARIKTHHNVGGVPEDLDFELVEPLRLLFKDEVRQIGRALGIPDELLTRQPFPGPGLAVRCVGEITPERLERLRDADLILSEELAKANLLEVETAQAFAVLLPVRSVGVMGDQRTYGETIVLRVVTTEDFMTADWARLPYELLARVSGRIVNEVEGINRVTYDITSKPPGTIEWE